jgi:PTH1 family peptidyl-tRNA hydrolase
MNNKFKYRLIVGLGNPGSRYASTYHNVGQLFLSWLMKHETWNIKHKLFMASQFKIHDSRFMIHVVKPLTFMNESGKTAKEAVKYFRAKPEEVLIVHDDSDIELGKYKISFGRGAAGHHGVESIIKSLGTKNFWRLRIGIRKTRKKAGEMVLKRITPADKLVLERLFSDLNPAPFQDWDYF